MKIGIIGGGAAGLMAAAAAHDADPTAEIFLLERNDGLGKKVIISGGGRCNVTTGIFDIKKVLTRYPRGSKFLSSAMHLFPPEQVYAWFEAHGVPLKIEDDLRVFPQSDDGRDIVGVFEKLFGSPRVRVLLNATVLKVGKTGDGFQVFLKGKTEPLLVDRLIITTGGRAYQHTGSTGDGYAFAKSLGHSITELAPSLSAFWTREKWPAEISGLSFQKATITAKGDKKLSFTGPFIFTHKGVSGPAVFAVSSLVAFESFDQSHPLKISIDLFPGQSPDALLNEMRERLTENPKRSLVNSLTGLVPKSLAETLCRELVVTPDKKAGEVSKQDVLRAAAWLKGIPLHVTARAAGDEFVTAGGVNLKEVNPSTMESKICPGLFLAGEILDIDGFTGGFNLQSAWATGHLAGENAVRG